ncbi:MAG TPA: outer membrane beta-barrel protein [Thermoanaerobaculia bacterium]
MAILRRKGFLAAVVVLAAAAPSRAQQFGVGASYGWNNDVEHSFKLENFHSPAWEGWLEMRVADDALVRATYGRTKIGGDNVGEVFSVGGAPVAMPFYRDRLDYLTVGASYLFLDGPVTTGAFAGIGGYSIRPEEVSPGLDPFRDQREKVFGWHVGVDGSVRVVRGLSVVGRATFHGILATSHRSILMTSLGAAYRF